MKDNSVNIVSIIFGDRNLPFKLEQKKLGEILPKVSVNIMLIETITHATISHWTKNPDCLISVIVSVSPVEDIYINNKYNIYKIFIINIMEKTNIRLNNIFLMRDTKNGKYYLTDEDVIDHWKELENKELKKFKINDITDKVNTLLNENDIYSNVNFIEITSDNIDNTNKKINISKLGGV